MAGRGRRRSPGPPPPCRGSSGSRAARGRPARRWPGAMQIAPIGLPAAWTSSSRRWRSGMTVPSAPSSAKLQRLRAAPEPPGRTSASRAAASAASASGATSPRAIRAASASWLRGASPVVGAAEVLAGGPLRRVRREAAHRPPRRVRRCSKRQHRLVDLRAVETARNRTSTTPTVDHAAILDRPARMSAAVRGVAQPGGAARLGRAGRRFKSCLPDHFLPLGGCRRTDRD